MFYVSASNTHNILDNTQQPNFPHIEDLDERIKCDTNCDKIAINSTTAGDSTRETNCETQTNQLNLSENVQQKQIMNFFTSVFTGNKEQVKTTENPLVNLKDTATNKQQIIPQQNLNCNTEKHVFIEQLNIVENSNNRALENSNINIAKDVCVNNNDSLSNSDDREQYFDNSAPQNDYDCTQALDLRIRSYNSEEEQDKPLDLSLNSNKLKTKSRSFSAENKKPPLIRRVSESFRQLSISNDHTKSVSDNNDKSKGSWNSFKSPVSFLKSVNVNESGSSNDSKSFSGFFKGPILGKLKVKTAPGGNSGVKKGPLKAVVNLELSQNGESIFYNHKCICVLLKLFCI